MNSEQIHLKFCHCRQKVMGSPDGDIQELFYVPHTLHHTQGCTVFSNSFPRPTLPHTISIHSTTLDVVLAVFECFCNVSLEEVIWFTRWKHFPENSFTSIFISVFIYLSFV